MSHALPIEHDRSPARGNQKNENEDVKESTSLDSIESQERWNPKKAGPALIFFTRVLDVLMTSHDISWLFKAHAKRNVE